MSTGHRLAAVVSLFATGSMLAGGVGLTSPGTGSLGSARSDVALVNITDSLGTILVPWADPSVLPNLQQIERFVLDAWLGIGKETLPQFMDPNGTTTLQTLFDGWGRLTSDNFTLGGANPSTMTDVFNAMGLNNIEVNAILGLLNLTPGESVSTALTAAGLGNVTLDQMLAGLNISDSTTLNALIDDWGMGGQTVSQLLTELGIGNGVTLDNLMTSIGLGQAEGFLPLMHLTAGTPVWSALATITGSTVTGTTTLDTLLGSGGLMSSIGSMTLGQLLGFSATTTPLTVLNGLQFDLGGTLTPLGSFTLTQLLGEIQLTPNESLAAVLGALPLGAGGAENLGTTTLASFLSVLDQGHTVDQTTTITAFLDNAGLGTQSIDTLLNLANVDISNWFIPAP